MDWIRIAELDRVLGKDDFSWTLFKDYEKLSKNPVKQLNQYNGWLMIFMLEDTKLINSNYPVIFFENATGELFSVI